MKLKTGLTNYYSPFPLRGTPAVLQGFTTLLSLTADVGWRTHPSEGWALSFHSFGPRCWSSTTACTSRQVSLGIHSSIYIHILVWIQTSVFRLSLFCHIHLSHTALHIRAQSLWTEFTSPSPVTPVRSRQLRAIPEQTSQDAGRSAKTVVFWSASFFWQHYLLRQTQPLLPGGKVSLVEPQTRFVTTPLPCTTCVGFFNWCVPPPPRVRWGQFSVHWYPHNTNQHFLLWKCALPASQLFFLTSPYSQGLILTPDSTFDSERPSGKFSDLDPHLPKTCQPWAGSLGNYKAYDERKSLIICSSSHRNTCRVLFYSSLTFLELHQHFFSYS